MNQLAPSPANPPLKLLSIVIPARDEQGCIVSTVEHLHLELQLKQIPHQIVVVDDGSTDRTWEELQKLTQKIPELSPVQNTGDHGFGRALVFGMNHSAGDAIVIMMADESDDCRDVVRYWNKLNEGFDCIFAQPVHQGSGGVIDYPWTKIVFLNRLANLFIKVIFRIPLTMTPPTPSRPIAKPPSTAANL